MPRKTRKVSKTLADYFTNDRTNDVLDDVLSDPHVRIVGRKEDVLRVKDKVMAVLDAKVSRIAFGDISNHDCTRNRQENFPRAES